MSDPSRPGPGPPGGEPIVHCRCCHGMSGSWLVTNLGSWLGTGSEAAGRRNPCEHSMMASKRSGAHQGLQWRG